jgi:hypothetical protein
MKKVIYGLCVVLCMQGMAEGQEVKVCGADIEISQYDKSLDATIIYESLECAESNEQRAAETSFRKPNFISQTQRLSIIFRTATPSDGIYTLVVLKDKKPIHRSGNSKGSRSSSPEKGFLSSVNWNTHSKPVEPPFECLLLNPSESEYLLRFTVSTIE